MGGFKEATVLGQGGISMGGQLFGQLGLKGGTLRGWAAWNGFGGDVSSFAALLEIPLDRGHRNLKGGSNLGLAMPLIDCPQDPLA
jgi:hypothetical protein